MPQTITRLSNPKSVALANAQNALPGQLAGQLAAALNPPPPAAGPFLRTPLRANIAAVLDLSTKEGRKYYERATESLFPSNEGFDVEPSKFPIFMNLLAIRARDLGFMEDGQIAQVPSNPANPLVGPFTNMITEYGRNSLDQIKDWETTFIAQQNRMAQNSKILFDLLMNSLSTAGKERIQVNKTSNTGIIASL